MVICDVSERFGNEVVKTLGPDAQFNKVDVTNRADVQQWVEGVVAKYGKVDILINNAGITSDAQFVKMKDGELAKQMSEEAFDKVISVNLKGVFNCTQAVVPYMIKQKGGVILIASSVVGLYGNFGQTNYVATKAAVIGMTKVWAREFGKYNIRVNAVARFYYDRNGCQDARRSFSRMRAKTPLGRLGEPKTLQIPICGSQAMKLLICMVPPSVWMVGLLSVPENKENSHESICNDYFNRSLFTRN